MFQGSSTHMCCQNSIQHQLLHHASLAQLPTLHLQLPKMHAAKQHVDARLCELPVVSQVQDAQR